MPSHASARDCADRAKQFMPFAALRGFYDLVAEASRPREDKRDLLADRADELDAALHEIQPGDFLTVEHYRGDIYVSTTGKLTAVREQDGQLVLDGIIIDFANIYDIAYACSDAHSRQ